MINNSYLLYRGPSLHNGEEIMVILTGLTVPSSNRKTGTMIQSWILPAAIRPTDAVKLGLDAAICGSCPLRGGACYVNLVGVNNIWSGADRLDMADGAVFDYIRRYSGMGLRLGAYGDPAMVPLETWLPAIQAAKFVTGYTHQWRTCDQRWQKYCHASVESLEDMVEAQKMNWTTFRIKLPGETLDPSEMICRNQENAFVKCTNCRLCSGNKTGKNITVDVHGAAYKINHFKKLKYEQNQ